MDINIAFTSNPENLIIFVIFIVLGFFLIIYVIDRIVDWLRFRKIAKSPELLKAMEEQKTIKAKRKFIPPTLIPKRVKVLVLREDTILEDMCRTDGEVVRCRNLGMMFTIPQSYRPYITMVNGKKLAVTLVFDEMNRAIRFKINNDGADAEQFKVDPRFQESIVGRKIFEQVFRRFAGIDWTTLISGIGLGVFVMVFIIFFVLPILGYPVTIGKIPVEVKIQSTQISSNLPPPGNYTPIGK